MSEVVNTSPSDQSWVLRPVPAYLWILLTSSPWFFITLFMFSISIAGLLFNHNYVPTEDHPSSFIHPYLLYVYMLLGLSVVGGITVFALFHLSYRRIRYIFTPQGITIERGINFEADFISWQQLNDVNVYESILQQCLKCGTIELASLRQPHKHLLYIPNPKQLYAYFKQRISHNIESSRRITSM